MPPWNPDGRPHSDLTRTIIESAIHVQNSLGVGLLLNFWACPLKDGGIQRLVLSRDRNQS